MTRVVFDDGATYDKCMGRWSRAVGKTFLDWMAPPEGARWLDVGCGTGVFTQLVLDTCSPASVIAVDPAIAQIDYARRQAVGRVADFRLADAQALPLPDRSFDVVASALVLNFIPDRARALTEMRRVGRPGGTVAAYVWDFAGTRSTAWPLVRGMREVGVQVPPIPGAESGSIDALESLFVEAGFDDIATRSIEVSVAFSDFEDFWQSQLPPFSPMAAAVAALGTTDRARLADAVRAALPANGDGGIAYAARANAVKGRVPA